jgi:Zn-dependent peptidase ImmA (M78 family)
MYARGFKSWCEKVSLQQRLDLGLRPTDPLDPVLLASHLDVLVWAATEVPGVESIALKVLTEEDPDSWSAVTLCTGVRDVIITNPRHRNGRRASDIMHELAHLIIGHEPARVDITEDGLLILNTFSQDQEDEAKWLSACLLLPRPLLLAIRRQRLDEATAAKKCGVSAQMLKYRMQMLGLMGTRAVRKSV